MMTKFYMSKVEDKYLDCGTLIKSENEQLTLIDSTKSDIPANYKLNNDWIELSENKVKYLLKRNNSERYIIHNSKLFEQIENLKPNDKCCVKIGKELQQFTVVSKNVKNNEYNVFTTSGKIKTISIFDIESVESLEYYINIRDYRGIVGSIMISGRNESVSNIEKVEKISLEEALFLFKFPCKKRKFLYENKFWEKINRLDVGDECYLRINIGNEYQIVEKLVIEDGIHYRLLLKNDLIMDNKIKKQDCIFLTASQHEIIPKNFIERCLKKQLYGLSRQNTLPVLKLKDKYLEKGHDDFSITKECEDYDEEKERSYSSIPTKKCEDYDEENERSFNLEDCGISDMSSQNEFQTCSAGLLMNSIEEINTVFKQGQSSKITIETHDQLKFLHENVNKIDKESLQIFESSSFIDLTRNGLDKILRYNFGRKKSVLAEDKIMLDCVMTILSIICDLCDSNQNFVKKLLESHSLIILNAVFHNLSKNNEPSFMRDQFVENVIFIYWNILKSGETLDEAILSKIKDLFYESNLNNQIRIAAALCLAFMNKSENEIITEVELFLKNLCLKSNLKEAGGFSISEMYMGLGRISMIRANYPDTQLQPKDSVSAEEYENILLLVTHENEFQIHSNLLTCIKTTIRMHNKSLISIPFYLSNYSINFDNEHKLFTDIISLNDLNITKSMLKKCKITSMEYCDLLELARHEDIEIGKLVYELFKQEDIPLEINIEALSIAFSYLTYSDFEHYEIFMKICKDVNEYIDNNETFLTKVIKELKVEQMTVALEKFVFDINKKNKHEEAPIYLTCVNQPNEKKLKYLLEYAKSKEVKIDPEDRVRAFEASKKLSNKEVFTKILFPY